MGSLRCVCTLYDIKEKNLISTHKGVTSMGDRVQDMTEHRERRERKCVQELGWTVSGSACGSWGGL
jgi:hypothetical protein